MTMPLVVYVMTQTLDDYKAEVYADGTGNVVYEEYEDGSGETSGVEEDAEIREKASDVGESDSREHSDDVSDTGDSSGSVDNYNDNTPGDWLTFESTAYIALCDTGCTGITFTGVDVRSSIYYEGDRVIAVDPAVIPLGSRVEIRLADGATFTARAIDTGGAINGHIIDLLVATETEAWAFGRQSVELRILGE